MPDPFPNELVEAAAKFLRDDRYGGGPERRGQSKVAARRFLAAVLPLIEQREEVCSRCGDHFSEHPGLPHVCGACMIGTTEDDRGKASPAMTPDPFPNELRNEET